jgi:hypothetical protein
MSITRWTAIAFLGILLFGCGIFGQNKMVVKNETEFTITDIRASLGGREQSRASLSSGDTVEFTDVAQHDDSMSLTYNVQGRIQNTRFGYVTGNSSAECRVYIESSGPNIHC